MCSDNPNLHDWRWEVAKLAVLAMNGQGRHEGPVRVRLVFWLARPQHHLGVNGVLPSAPPSPVKKPDLDKLIRAIFDALTIADVWRDDAQATEVSAIKRFADTLHRPGVRVEVEACS
jgi:crossover junction endodeoxyribonuclease RusA